MFFSRQVALGLSIFAATALAVPAIPTLTASPVSKSVDSVAARDAAVRLSFYDAAQNSVWVDVPLDVAYISPINLNGMAVSTIAPWVNYDAIYCVFWNEYPDVTKPSIPVSAGADQITRFDPATQITYIQCCTGECADWANWA